MTDYNEWLRDYLMDGGTPDNYYDYPLENHTFVIVENPEGIGFPAEDMTGTMSRDFVLNRNFHVEEHARRFVGGHNTLYGWDKDSKPRVCASRRGSGSVPVFTDTVDRQMVTDKQTPGNVRVELSIGHMKADSMKRIRDEGIMYNRTGEGGYEEYRRIIAKECIKDALQQVAIKNREYRGHD